MPEVIQRKVQAGLESSRGTGVAATRILNGVLTPWTIDRNLVWSPVNNGMYVSRQKGSYTRPVVTSSYNEAASYEDIAWWMKFVAEGGVTGVSDSGTPSPGYLYAFDPDLTTDSLESATFECGVPGHVEDFLQVMVDSMTLRIAPDNTSEPSWMLDAQLKALGLPSAGTFASLTVRETEEIRAAGTKIFIDDDPANVGTTQKTGWLIDASLTFNLMRHFKAFAENADGFAPGKTGRGERTTDVQITYEFDDYDEYNEFLSSAPVLRAVRLYQEGSIIHSTVRKSIAIDIIGYWATFAESEREGNITAVMALQGGLIDATFGNDYKVEVLNGLATLV